MEGAGPGRLGNIIVGLRMRLSLNQCWLKITYLNGIYFGNPCCEGSSEEEGEDHPTQ